MSQSEKAIVPGRYPEPAYPSTAAAASTPVRTKDETTHLDEYLNVLLARRWTIVAVLLTVVTIIMVRAFKEVPIYRATVVVQIDRDSQKILNSIDNYTPQLDEAALQTYYRNLASRSLAREVIVDLRLDEEAGGPGDAPGLVDSVSSSARRVLSNTIAAVVAPPKQPESKAVGDSPATDRLRPFIDGYLVGLSIAPIARSRLVNVSVERPDPRLAALIANSHANHFVEKNISSRFEGTQVVSNFLKKQVMQMEASLEQDEDKLNEYGQKHQMVILEGKNADISKLGQLEDQYTKAQTERIVKSSAAKLLKDQGGPVDPASDARLAELRRRDAELAVTYQPEYSLRKAIRSQIAEIERTIETERAAAIKRAEADYAAAVDRESLFRHEFEAQRVQVDAMNQYVVQYNLLKRKADSSRALHDALLNRLQEAGVASSLNANNIRVVDAAEVPTTPVRPDKRRSLMTALAVGLALGIGLAFFQEYMDSSLKSPDDVTKYFKLPTLAVIPRLGSILGKEKRRYGYSYMSNYLPGAKKEKPETGESEKRSAIELVTHEAPSSLLSEAYRSLRASMILSTPDHPPRTILISSAIPSEGKTSTTANIAVSLTQIGARTVLLDCDMRKPRIGKIFGLEQKQGLSNFLSGSAQLTEVVHETHVPGLFVIPCGAIPPNPGELILSNRFKHMMEVLSKYFDYVVLDSPPLNNVSDAKVLASNVDAMILVVKALSTSRHVVQRALAHLEDSRSKLVGVVLNDFDMKSKGSYYYSYGSGRYYQQYYYQSDADKSPVGVEANGRDDDSDESSS